MPESTPLSVRVSGDLACFTRPEMKVERVSYPVMTPSAARGVLEAIFWKPEFRWVVRSIEVLRPIRFVSLQRNEINGRQSETTARLVLDGDPYLADEDRAQRQTLALRDVAYVIHADVQLQPGVHHDVAKYRDMFRRRVRKGQRFQQPFFGCREFAAMFDEPVADEKPIPETRELGRMLHDVEYRTDRSGSLLRRTHAAGRTGIESVSASPRFFRANLQKGVLVVPEAA